ncbi:MAG: hypothetical protein IJT83_06655 [Victivallales bacterium]|nr:hypothetical protein [Victivallales bacterium]
MEIRTDFRPVPFWSWNDVLVPEELRHQVREMHDKGIGGFFMHARGGLLTKYFSKEWFDAVEATVDEAIKVGAEPWLYDENGWPSGFGNGMVNGLGEKYQQKYLRMTSEEKAADIPVSRIIAKIDCKVFYYDVNPYYVDNLDAEVTHEFIRQVYEAYKEKLSPRAWAAVKGFFTDEPQLSRNGVPWSLILPDEYRAAYGRDLLSELPAIFTQCEGYRAVRVRYWSLLTRLFRDNFLRQIHDWCEANGKLLTGHHVLEETYEAQLYSNGAIMPQYEFYHIPGVDWLGRTTPNAVGLNQLQSVAAQTGKERLLVETFALCGWNVNFQDMRWMYQLQMARGINFLCQHLESYSLRGARKRDYPASLFQHQPWWDKYRLFNDYVSRIGQLLADGVSKTPVLVLHGQSTAWTEYNCGDNGRLSMYYSSFAGLTAQLEARQVPFHYGDETIIAEKGRVNGSKFIVGLQSYELVVLPKLNNISATEKSLLEEFAKNGGRIIGVQVANNDAYTVDGEQDASLQALLDKVYWCHDEEEVAILVAKMYQLCEISGDRGKIIATRRIFADFQGAPAELLFFVNSSNAEAAEVSFHFQGTPVARFMPDTGEFVSVEAGQFDIPYRFEPGGSLLLMVRPVAKASSTKPAPTYQMELLTPNTLTLDTCRCYVDGKLLAEKIETISLMAEALKFEKDVNLRLEFEFQVADSFDTGKPLMLLVESPEIFAISFNGEKLDSHANGFLFDQAFATIPLPPCKHGVNIVTLETLFHQEPEVYANIRAARIFEAERNKLSFNMELESIYIAGDFAVRNLGSRELIGRNAERLEGPFVIDTLGHESDGSNLQNDGLPFFAGKVKLTGRFDATCCNCNVFRFSQFFANVAEVRLNGVELGALVWRPYDLAIPHGVLREKENLLEITLTNNLRNLLGPHHLKEGESWGVTPWSFFKDKHFCVSSLPPQWNDKTCIVRFGFELDNL